jgi:Secretion system C-terminal sorting domain
MPKTTILYSIFLFLFPFMMKAQVAIIAFSGIQVKNEAQISWTIGRGNTCQDLEVQHSTDGVHFNTVYTYLGICGDASFDQSYSWTHSNPTLNSLNYYRLFAAPATISDTIQIEVIGYNENGYAVYPNPTREAATIYFQNPNNSAYRVSLVSLKGETVFLAENFTGTMLKIAHPEANGYYVLSIQSSDGNEFRTRILFE